MDYFRFLPHNNYFQEGEICCFYNKSAFVLENLTKTEVCALPTAAELRAALGESENSGIRSRLAMLFDDSTFVETAAYTKRAFSEFLATDKANELEGVITGYGAVDGKLVYVFAEDIGRAGAVIDERHAKKITDLYRLALHNGAPVIGIFDSDGTDIFMGTSALAAYGKIMKTVADASGVIPQIAVVSGKCIGTAASIAALFDFVIKEKDAAYYVSSPELVGVKDAQSDTVSFSGDTAECFAFARSLVSFLPENASVGSDVGECADNLNRMLGDLDFAGEGLSVISTVADNAVFYEIGKEYAPVLTTAFATVGGVRCGMIATSFSVDEGRLTAEAAKKATKFINFCDCFGIPLVTFADSLGLAVKADNEPAYADALASLAFAYASSDNAKVTVILGHAIGAAFVLLGSTALGADLVYATDSSEIGALPAESGVAFAWDKYITLETKRTELITRWKESVSSPVHAACSGEIDDIIGVNELRARICSALLMLAGKTRF